jgi:two-component system KDP operon response regulator KdpE
MQRAVSQILIVDDEPQFRRALRLSLEVQGFDVRDAGSGSEALNLIRSRAPDLILLDWRMPGADGGQVCRAIRACSDVPIIVVTSRQRGRSEALAAGANDYLTKPFAFDELMTRIASALTK